MSPGFLTFASVLCFFQLFLPKRFAFVPLIVGACHLGNTEIVAELTVSRMLITLGLFRAVLTGSLRFSFGNLLDRIMVIFSVCAIVSSVGHNDAYFNPWVARAGLVLNVFGSYLYGRAYLPDLSAVRRFALILPFVVAPLAVNLSLEKVAQRNFYAFLGSGSFVPAERDGKIRAQGPFRHPILAGCAGATALPLSLLLLRRRRWVLGAFGCLASITVVLACASSGPLAAVAVSLLAVVLWRWKRYMRIFLWSGFSFAIFYWIVAGRGPWYIMASLDLVGGSTGWHRSKLIDQGFKYFWDWWLWGTDYTRHWMATGVSWSPDHVDLTNYYLHLGVTGGVVLPVAIIGALIYCLYGLYAGMRFVDEEMQLFMWYWGAMICTHAISFVSISYFDQMFVFFYLSLAAVPGLLGGVRQGASEPVDQSDDSAVAGAGSIGAVGN